MKILCMGSVNVDKTFRVDHIPKEGETILARGFRQGWGGKGLNQAVALAKSCDEVYFAGNAGVQDAALGSFLRQHNIHDDYLNLLEDAPTGVALINVDKNGQNAIVVYGGANQTFTEEYIDRVLGQFETGDMLLLQNEINGLDHILRRAKAAGMQIAMNPSPFEETLKALPLDLVDLFLVNEVEGYQITGCQEPEAILQELERQYSRAAVVLTLGGLGAWYGDAAGERDQPAFSVRAVDTTGAGDTFTGYFLAALTRGESPADAMRWGAAAAALAVTRPGAGEAVPLRDEVERFLSGENHS